MQLKRILLKRLIWQTLFILFKLEISEIQTIQRALINVPIGKERLDQEVASFLEDRNKELQWLEHWYVGQVC
jgi:hypothetical protein